MKVVPSGICNRAAIHINMIKCIICDKELKQITRNHLLRHDITVAQYRERFPTAPLQDESIIMKAENNPFFGKSHSDEVKQRLRNHFSGKSNPKAGAKISALWKDPNGTYRKMMASDSYRQIMRNVTQAHWNSSESDSHRLLNKECLTRLRPMYEERLNELRKTQAYRKALSDSIKIMWSTMPQEEKNKRVVKQLTTVMNDGVMSSKGENELFLLLRKKYPNTRRFVWFHSSETKSEHMWNIDFFIPEIQTYVQFDGVYWHGLDRPIEEIQESSSKRDKAIYRKWLIDQEQNVWFVANQKRLIRITDVEWADNPELCMKKIEQGYEI